MDEVGHPPLVEERWRASSTDVGGVGEVARVGVVRGLREQAGRAVFRLVAGPRGEEARARIHGTPGPRWFAPDSAIVRVHGDASMFVGGLRAVMLQTLHPAAMTAVSEHSGYRGDLFGRVARTSTFLATTTFGTAEHAEQAVAAVRRVHEQVTGTLPDGTPYSASDPHLLTWVHIAEIDSFLRAHQAYGAEPLDPTGCDAYVAEAGVVAGKLGVPDPPLTQAELVAALASYRPELRGTPAAREALDHVVHHPPVPLAARPAYAALVAAATALMPPWSRHELGLPHRPLVDRTVARASGELATRGIRFVLQPGRTRARVLYQAHAGRPPPSREGRHVT